MRGWRLAFVAALGLLPLGLTDSALSETPLPSSLGSPLADGPAPPGMRTVCLGRTRDGVRAVACFEVYRLDIGGVVDPAKGVDLQQYVWKYTAEAEADGRRVVKLAAEVNSDAATVYDWAPGATVRLEEPGELEAAVSTDLRADNGAEGTPQVKAVTDGWRYRGLAGRFDPRLSDHRFATSWTAPDGKTAPTGEIAQVAGATVWGASAPGPPLLPAWLRMEVTYR